jgi:hypothetical protein
MSFLGCSVEISMPATRTPYAGHLIIRISHRAGTTLAFLARPMLL